TIRAPRSTDRQDHHAATKSRIRIRHHSPVEIRSAEVKWLARISDRGKTRQVRWLGNPFGPQRGAARGSICEPLIERDTECAVWIERGFEDQRPVAGKVTHGQPAILPPAD